MDKTLTIRLDASQDEALTRRAKALGRTRSQLVRDLIDKGLEEQPLGITEILTLDRRGFSTYRTSTGRKFRLVLDAG